jgi:hypothetical protein
MRPEKTVSVANGAELRPEKKPAWPRTRRRNVRDDGLIMLHRQSDCSCRLKELSNMQLRLIQNPQLFVTELRTRDKTGFS